MSNNKKGNSIPGEFTAIPDSLLGVGFDIYEIIIISSVQSWTRQNKKFYESKGRIAEEYGCCRATISRKFLKLIKQGILVQGKKHAKGQYEYSVNLAKLFEIINQFKCNLELQQTASAVTESNSKCNLELQNNTPKTINKNSFRVEVEKKSTSPTEEEVEAFIKNLK